jgi:hypothetical protein
MTGDDLQLHAKDIYYILDARDESQEADNETLQYIDPPPNWDYRRPTTLLFAIKDFQRRSNKQEQKMSRSNDDSRRGWTTAD